MNATGRDGRFEAAVDAIVTGDLRKLRRLVEQDPDLVSARSLRDHRATLLHYVSANGVEDERQKTPANAVAIADLLIAAGADINATAEFHGGGPGSTPLIGLVTSGHPARAGLMEALVRSFAASGQSLNGIDDDGLPIRYALEFRQLSAARTLAACGARLGSIAVAAAVGSRERVEQTLRDGPPADAELQRALRMAARAGETAILERLIGLGTDVDARADDGVTALHEAAFGACLDCVKRLNEAGARVDLRDMRFRATPVGWAAANGNAGVVEYLLEHAAVDLIDLVQLGREDLVRRRLDERPGDKTAAGSGVPLWAAAAAGDLEMVRYLLARGADRNVTDPDGKSARDWALELGHDEIVAALAQADESS